MLYENEKSIYEVIFENANDAIFIMDGEGLVECNKAAVNMFGYAFDGYKGKTPFDFSPATQPDGSISKDLGKKYINEAFTGEKSRRFEWIYSRLDGTLFDAEVSLDLVNTSNNLFLFVIIRDLSAIKKAESARSKFEEKYRQIVESAPIAIYQRHLDGRFIYCNKNQLKEFECRTLDEFLEKYSNVDIVWADHVQLELFKELIFRYKEINNYEVKVVLKSGKTKYFSVSAFLDEREQIINGFSVDITESKSISEALVQSEIRLKTLLKTLPDLVWMKDPAGSYLLCNTRFESFVGQKEEYVVGKKDYDLFEQNLADFFRVHDMNAIEAGKPTINEEQITFASDGHKEIVETIKTPVYANDGEIMGVLGISRDITQRNNTEKTLEVSESKYRRLHTSMTDGFVLIDMEGRIKEFNESYQKMLGYSPAELVKLYYPDITPEKWHKNEEEIIHNQIITNGYSSIYEKEYQRKDGSIFPVELRIYLLKNEAGENEGMWAIVRDITERKKSQQKLAEEQAILSSIIENTNDLIWAVDHVNFSFIKFNSAFRDYYKTNGIIIEIGGIMPNTHSSILARNAKILYKRAISSGSFTIENFQGVENKTFSISVNPLKQDEQIFGVSVFARDVTNIKKSQNALVASEQRLQKLLGSVTDYIYTVTIKNNVVENTSHGDGCIAVTGYLPEDFHENPLLWFQIIHDEDKKAVKKQIHNLMNFHDSTPMEHRIVRKDGSVHWVRNAPVLRFSGNGAFIGYDGLINDITERKIAELALAKSEERFRQVITLSGHIVYEIDLADYSILWGGAIESTTGFTLEEFRTVTFGLWLDMIHPDDRNRVQVFFEAFIKNEVKFCTECRFRTRSGEYIWIETESFIMQQINGLASKVLGVMKNINHRKNLERQVLNSVIETEEQERLHFSQELHDGLGPLLSAIKMYVQWLAMPNAKLDPVSITADIEKLVDEATATVRNISFKLSPHILKNYGLMEALKAYTDRIQKSSPINIHIEEINLRRFSEVAETITYRVLCECINNTLKYAYANNIFISISLQQELLNVEYSDDGIGFDISIMGTPRGIGLLNMQSRLKSINGIFNINSSPGMGTNIKFNINLGEN